MPRAQPGLGLLGAKRLFPHVRVERICRDLNPDLTLVKACEVRVQPISRELNPDSHPPTMSGLTSSHHLAPPPMSGLSSRVCPRSVFHLVCPLRRRLSPRPRCFFLRLLLLSSPWLLRRTQKSSSLTVTTTTRPCLTSTLLLILVHGHGAPPPHCPCISHCLRHLLVSMAVQRPPRSRRSSLLQRPCLSRIPSLQLLPPQTTPLHPFRLTTTAATSSRCSSKEHVSCSSMSANRSGRLVPPMVVSGLPGSSSIGQSHPPFQPLNGTVRAIRKNTPCVTPCTRCGHTCTRARRSGVS